MTRFVTILVFIMVILPAWGKEDIFYLMKDTKLSVSPIESSIETSYASCGLRCLVLPACLAFNFNKASSRCELLDKNAGTQDKMDNIVGRIGKWCTMVPNGAKS